MKERNLMLLLILVCVSNLKAQKMFFTQIDAGYSITSLNSHKGTILSGGIGYGKANKFYYLNLSKSNFGYRETNLLEGGYPVLNKSFEEFPFQVEKELHDYFYNDNKGLIQLDPKLFNSDLSTIELGWGSELGKGRWKTMLGFGIKHSSFEVKTSASTFNATITYNNKTYNNVTLPINGAYSFYDIGLVPRLGLGYSINEAILVFSNLKLEFDLFSKNTTGALSLGVKTKVFNKE
jgi:hypothetical protein